MNPTIHIEGEHFALTISNGKCEHTVLIPINEPNKLVALLQARRANQLRIAEPGSPTQWNVDRRARERPSLTDLQELGIL